MKTFILFLALVAPTVVFAGSSSSIAWTPETLNFVKHGNADKGKELAQTCAACHGEEGVSAMPETPSLAGQLATYTYKELRDYAQDNRSHPMMTAIAKGLSEQQSADLAVWFSTLKSASGEAVKQLAKAEKMVEEGDGKRILPPCFVCHGANGKGEKLDIPALSGQRADYLAKTLLEYKTGQRHNDIYSRMRLIAQQLSETEIKDLAEYYQQMK
ncbi:MAG: c-type cytochrome [Methylococcaceae bacterium]|jgi:cytochrome c553|nr:c-type cytochrome [Methylococcaceae bacterium]MDZ4156529.1 c-type cytochrome [Methylococcales bacterium]MDP2393637.1 c-type cytochrome [Methylococcaceae bacterium]MDP3020727.1 c-type cytochrome [Methylococcaceae bacterium]MDP3390474.1 c-type cytochrome [Methylococcaceae bacterium]